MSEAALYTPVLALVARQEESNLLCARYPRTTSHSCKSLVSAIPLSSNSAHTPITHSLSLSSLNVLLIPRVSLRLAPHDLDCLRFERREGPFWTEPAEVAIMERNARIPRSVDRHGRGVPPGLSGAGGACQLGLRV